RPGRMGPLGRPQPGRRRLKLVRLQPRRHHRRSGQSHHRSQSRQPVPSLSHNDAPGVASPLSGNAALLGTSSTSSMKVLAGSTADELVLVPPRDPHYPKKQKPQPKPGFISAQPPQPYLGSIASQPSLISSSRPCTSSSDRGVSSSATPA